MIGADDPRPPALAWIVCALLLAGFGARLFRDAAASSSIGWMDIYQVQDFAGLPAVLEFFRDLRIAIPPWLAALEFIDYALTGTNNWVPVYLYRVAMVGAFVLAVMLTYPSFRRLAVAVPLAVLFLAAARLIHPAGPNVYDAIYPFLLLGYFLALRAAPGSAWAALAAGLLLALAELTRPFVLLLLPILLLGVAASPALRRASRLLPFLVPLVVLSGGWHAYQFWAHGQVFWSNHGGYNLQRAWPMVEMPPLVPETVPAKRAPDRMESFNTPEHVENSRRLQRAILCHIAAHPLASAMHALERVSAVVAGEVVLHGEVPSSPVIAAYQVVAKFPALWMLLGALAVAIAIVAHPRRAGRILADDGNLLILVTAATIVIVALTEAGEEARFMIALLPALAAVPMPRLDFATRPARHGVVARRLGAAVAILAVVGIEVFAQGAVRRSAGFAEGAVPAPTQAKPGDDALRIGLLHVRGGRWPDRERAIAAIGRCLQGLDVIGLNGVNGTRLFSSQPDQATLLARATGRAAIFAPTERRWWSDWYGNALLTGVAVTNWKREPLPAPRTPPRRNMLIATVETGDRRVSLLLTQVDFGYDNRLQLELAIERFLRLPPPAVLMGELNTSRDAPAMQALLALPGVDAFTVNLPSPVGPRPIDWIVTRGFEPISGETCDTGVSDHLLLSVRLRPSP
ncbi:MAG: hypothetical protein IT562_15775 [Alphaproteobacteria bacterium]|nr:hypothetical protein [Alphaproteobacteria bacterium]